MCARAQDGWVRSVGCAVQCGVEGGSSPFLGSYSFALVVCFSFRESLSVGLHRRLFGAQPGSSQHFRVWNRRRLFRAQPGSSQRFRVRSPPAVQSTAGKLPTLSGSVAAGCSEHSRKLPTLTALVAVGCLKHSQEAPLGSMRPCRPCIPLVLLPPRRLCLIWHMAPAVCWINVVEALHALIQPSKHKRHTVARI